MVVYRFMPKRLRDHELNLSYGTCNFGLLLETGFMFTPVGLPYSFQDCIYGQTYISAKARRPLKIFRNNRLGDSRGNKGGGWGKITRVFPTYPLLIGRLRFGFRINGSIVIVS